MTNLVARLGAATLEVLRILGHHAALFWALLRACGAAFKRPYLIVAQAVSYTHLTLPTNREV